MDQLIENNARGADVNWREVANTMYLSSTFSEQEVCFIVASEDWGKGDEDKARIWEGSID